ncbi:MAG TPA: NHL repeat-containing protein, partial [Chitinophagaceae bacterium]|nr:NHL repeat-containing protein [Chitinophagaceae bacterium]
MTIFKRYCAIIVTRSKLFSINLKNLILFLVFFPQFIIAQNITTLAGNGTGGYNGDNISASTAQLYGPQGIALDASRNVYIADLVNNRIRRVDALTNIITTIAGTGIFGFSGDGGLAINAQIAHPSALAFDATGDLFFTDRGNNRIRKITISTGIINTIAGTGTAGYSGDGGPATSAQLNSPNEVSFDASGNLFIADWYNNRVRKIDISTGIITTIAGTGTAGYSGDGGLAINAQIFGPCGIIFDNTGNIYFAEYNGSKIRKINISNNIISTFAGTASPGFNGDGGLAVNTQLASCAYIRFDDAQNMYVGDAGNHRIRRIDNSTTIVTTVAGTGTAGYSGDGGPATSAHLNLPFEVYFDRPQCYMYIGDYSNHRVRVIAGGFIGCVATPLFLISFTGENKGNYNLLHWQTSTPNNNKNRFDIERSDDSQNFKKMGEINSSSANSYSFIDLHPPDGT